MSASNLPKSESSLSADYCVVGTGMVGLATAKSLLDHGASVVMVDSGYNKYNRIIQDLNSGFSGPFGHWPIPNYPVSYHRIRAIGGTSMIWGGWCRELNDWDFRANDKCNISWPFSFNELKPFYQEAREMLGVNINETSTNTLPPDALVPLIKSNINCASETFQEDLLSSLLKKKNFTLVPGFTLVGLPIKKATISKAIFYNSTRIDPDRNLTVTANSFILCCGGIENARLLLAHLPKPITQGLPIGLGFMEHPKVLAGRFYPSNEVVINYLQSFSPGLSGRSFIFKAQKKLHETLCFGELQLPHEIQKINGLGNAVLGFRESNIFDAASLVSLRHILLTKNILACGPIRPSRLISLARDASRVILGKLVQKIKIIPPSFFVHVQCEQYPNDSNSVSLTDIKDSHNTSRVRLNWKMSKEDVHTVVGTVSEFQKIVNKNNIGSFTPEKQLFDIKKQLEYLELNAHGAGHHMGTTRMGTDETSSVCDSTGKIWRLKNLFIFGSSLFPRGGAANPSLTAVALALRNLQKIMDTH